MDTARMHFKAWNLQAKAGSLLMTNNDNKREHQE